MSISRSDVEWLAMGELERRRTIHHQEAHHHIDSLRATLTRYEKALREIAEYPPKTGNDCFGIAKKALEGK